jgi:hypothetical protein
VIGTRRLHARPAYAIRVDNRAAYVMRFDTRARISYATAKPAVRKSLRCYAACAWIDTIRSFYGALTAKIAVFCNHLPLKNARASYPIFFYCKGILMAVCLKIYAEFRAFNGAARFNPAFFCTQTDNRQTEKIRHSKDEHNFWWPPGYF